MRRWSTGIGRDAAVKDSSVELGQQNTDVWPAGGSVQQVNQGPYGGIPLDWPIYPKPPGGEVALSTRYARRWAPAWTRR
jgi:hypothetical protein